jgi:hypothetical protein
MESYVNGVQAVRKSDVIRREERDACVFSSINRNDASSEGGFGGCNPEGTGFSTKVSAISINRCVYMC